MPTARPHFFHISAAFSRPRPHIFSAGVVRMHGKVLRLCGALCLFALLLALPALLPVGPVVPGLAGGGASTAQPPPSPAPSPAPTATPAAPGWRAVWVSYLEWQSVDFSTPARYTADITQMLDDIAGLGANVVLAHVRPFGDALYPSAYYPFSHLCTGAQGQDPGYDPLALLLTQAHARGLQVEAWINPYRIQAGGAPALCAQSPALRHPDWAKAVDGGLYLDPASAAVRQFIADAVAELCANYPLDGIHFDDYFYPTTDPAFDEAAFAASGAADRDAWRCQNVNALVALCWQAAHRYGVRFGIAPQGDPDAARAGQYSDAAAWLAAAGYVDYLAPQLYWGLNYQKSGDSSHSITALAARWDALPRAPGVALYWGLGGYRIGVGDGGDGSAPLREWQSGAALAGQFTALAGLGSGGAAVYRYASLFGNERWPTLAGQEVVALRNAWAG